MSPYRIALFVHLLALLTATSVSTITSFASRRRMRARTVGELLEWHSTIINTARVFPLCIAVLVLTGWYMVSSSGAGLWGTGFVVAGFAGVTWLLASGAYLGVKGKAMERKLQEMAAAGADRPAPRLAPPAPIVMLPASNMAVALAVTFCMVTKPASVATSLAIVVASGAGAALVARAASTRRLAPAPATQ